MSRYRFKGGTTSSTNRTKTSWPVEAKAQILALVDNGSTAPEAVQQIADDFGIDLADKPSYIKNAGSHVSRFRKELENAMSNPKHKKHAEAVKACQDAGLDIEPVLDDDEDEDDFSIDDEESTS